MKTPFLALFIIACCFSCKDNPKTSNPETKDLQLEELHQIMQGSFSSEKQSIADSSYYNISLHSYPIWEDKGHFLYLEQALNSMQDKPYRQRIYKLSRKSDSTFASEIYLIDNEDFWIGKWKNPVAFDSISMQDITLKDGCAVILKRIAANHFIGKTTDTTCKSSLRGASVARSEVEILKDKLMSWDRGFDSDGNYVWGAEKSGYVFEKIN